MSSSISSTIDRITTNALAASTGVSSEFIPTSTWQGSKPGYYFGTSTKGTGYYLDDQLGQKSNNDSSSKRSRDEGSDVAGNGNQRRRVRFGEDEIKTIPAVRKPSAAELLEQAEKDQELSQTSRKTLDLTRGVSSLKSFVKKLEKSIAKNGLLRADYPDEPERFMESEVGLYEDIAVLNDLATAVEHYEYFVKMGAVDQLIVLLGHENVDVALAVIRLFLELLDPALFVGDERVALSSLIRAFVGDGESGNGGLGMVIGNLSRLHKTEEEEEKGIADVFSLIENMFDLDQMGALQLGTSNDSKYISIHSILVGSTTFVSFLLTNLADKKESGWKTPMRLHGSELLAAILQNENSRQHIDNLFELETFSSVLDEDEGKKTSLEKVDGMECLLQCIATYRKKDPSSEEECEYLENIFDSLSASLLNEKNVDSFLERQGVELMLRCINESVHSGSGAMKVLYFALSGASNVYKRAAETFVDAGGFKTLFPMFMGKKSLMPKPSKYCDAGNISVLRKFATLNKKANNGKRQSKKMKQVVAANKEWFQILEAHSIQLLYGLTRHLDSASAHDAKARLLSKFVENDCEKCDRMIEFCLKYDIKMRKAEYKYYKSDEAEEAEADGVDIDLAALSAKLEGGGDLFHRISVVIAFAAKGSKRCHEYILEQLRTQNSGIGVIKTAIQEFVNLLDEGVHREELQTYLDAI